MFGKEILVRLKNFKFNDSWTGPDKIRHLGAGFTIAFVIANVTRDYNAAVVAGIAVSVGKEVYDVISGKGTGSFQDLVVTSAGAALGIGLYYLIDKTVV